MTRASWRSARRWVVSAQWTETRNPWITAPVISSRVFPEYVCIEDVDKIISSVHQENLSQLYSYRQLKISGGNGKGPRPTTARIHAQVTGTRSSCSFEIYKSFLFRSVWLILLTTRAVGKQSSWWSALCVQITPTFTNESTFTFTHACYPDLVLWNHFDFTRPDSAD